VNLQFSRVSVDPLMRKKKDYDESIYVILQFIQRFFFVNF